MWITPTKEPFEVIPFPVVLVPLVILSFIHANKLKFSCTYGRFPLIHAPYYYY